MPERMRMAERFAIRQRVRDSGRNDKWKWFAKLVVAAQIRRVKKKVAILFLILLVSPPSLWAQGPAPSPLLSPAPVLQPAAPLPELALAHELTKPDLEAFLDALIPAQLQSRDIAGAVIS